MNTRAHKTLQMQSAPQFSYPEAKILVTEMRSKESEWNTERQSLQNQIAKLTIQLEQLKEIQTSSQQQIQEQVSTIILLEKRVESVVVANSKIQSLFEATKESLTQKEQECEALRRIKLVVSHQGQGSHTFEWKNFPLLQQKQYEDLLNKLHDVQLSLLNRDSNEEKQQQKIEERNQLRKQIISIISEIEQTSATQVKAATKQVESFITELVSEKLIEHNIIQMKEQLNKDIAMEEEMQALALFPIAKLEEDIKEKQAELAVFEKREQKNPNDTYIKKLVEELEEELHKYQCKLNRKKELNSIMNKNNNPLFGFPELRSEFISKLQQEEIEDINKEYAIDTLMPKGYVARGNKDDTTLFIKKFHKVGEWKRFKTEVDTLKNLNHPCVISINRVMYDQHFYYIEMPYIPNGTLYDWLSNQRTPHEIQHVMRLVVQAIDYLHENSVLHRDLKLQNIMMQNDQIPIIIDFDVSKNLKNQQTTVFGTPGTQGYIAPEVLEGNKHTVKSDVYAYGVCLAQSYSIDLSKFNVRYHYDKEEPILNPTDFFVEDEELLELLKWCLHKDPKKRPFADQIFYSNFFSKHLDHEHEQEKKVKTENRIAIFKEFVKVLKDQHQPLSAPVVDFPIKKSRIVEDVTKQLLLFSKDPVHKDLKDLSLYSRFDVEFEGEIGVDGGALTTSLFNQYFQQFIDQNILEKPSHYAHICTDEVLAAKIKYKEKRRDWMVGLGIMICKCLYEHRSIGPYKLCDILIKYLKFENPQSIDCSLREYEQFDEKTANILKKFQEEDVVALSLDFSNIEPDGDEKEVTNENLDEYIRLKCQHDMIKSRRQNLEWIREGFYKMDKLKKYLQQQLVNDFHVLLTGASIIDIKFIVENCIKFEENSNQHQDLQDWLNDILKNLQQDEFKQFLYFCTGYATTQSKDQLFENGNQFSSLSRNCITVKFSSTLPKNFLPVASVCSYLLTMPNYESKEKMFEKLKLAISGTDDSFHMI